MIYKLLLLFAGHALCDYPLQGDFLARGKNHRAPLPGVPWYQCLFAHALIHAAMVFLITRSLLFAVLELIIHAGTDYAKCEGWFGRPYPGQMHPSGTPISAGMARMMGVKQYTGIAPFNIDQAIHYACKVLWAIL